MEIFILEIIKDLNHKDMDNIIGLTEQSIKEISFLGKNMVKEIFLWNKEILMRDNIWTIKNADKVDILGKMDHFIKGNSKMILGMGMAKWYIQILWREKVIGVSDYKSIKIHNNLRKSLITQHKKKVLWDYQTDNKNLYIQNNYFKWKEKVELLMAILKRILQDTVKNRIFIK